jgi:maltose O-acetyltransferase
MLGSAKRALWSGLLACVRFWNDRRLRKYVRGGMGMGKDVNIQPGVIIDASHYWHVSIGDRVTIAPGVRIIAHDASTKRHLGFTRIGKIRIGDGVFIGAGSIVLPGVTIGDNSIVGAGSVVTRDVPPGMVVGGNPARILCSLDSFLEKRREEMARYPCFGADYALPRVTRAMRREMNGKMTRSVAYIV